MIGNSFLHLDGSKKMTDNLDMDEHHILSVKNLTDHKVGDFFFLIISKYKRCLQHNETLNTLKNTTYKTK